MKRNENILRRNTTDRNRNHHDRLKLNSFQEKYSNIQMPFAHE